MTKTTHREPRVEDLPPANSMVALEVLRLLHRHGEMTRAALEKHGISQASHKWLKRLLLLGFIEVRQADPRPGVSGYPPMLYRLAPRWRGEGAA